MQVAYHFFPNLPGYSSLLYKEENEILTNIYISSHQDLKSETWDKGNKVPSKEGQIIWDRLYSDHLGETSNTKYYKQY